MSSISLGMASFARFYEASPPVKVRVVRDIRFQRHDPEGYKARNYYHALLVVLRTWHWQRGDISELERGLIELQEAMDNAAILKPGKRKHYLAKQDHFSQLGTAYLSGWFSRGAQSFEVRPGRFDLASVAITVNPEIGMRFGGNEFVLKLWLNAAKPTRQFQQVLQYLVNLGRPTTWESAWEYRLWDVRRDRILPAVTIPKDFGIGVKSQAAALRVIWNSLEQESESNAANSPQEDDIDD